HVRTAVRTKSNVTVESGGIRCPSLAMVESPESLLMGKNWQPVAPLGVLRPGAQPELRIRRLGVRIPPSALCGLDPLGRASVVSPAETKSRCRRPAKAG